MLEDPVFETENSSTAGPLMTRRNLLALGAVAGLALTLPALPAKAVEFEYSDAIALRFLREVAQLEADFFYRAATSPTAEGLVKDESNAFAWISKQDRELVRWFNAAKGLTNLGGADTFFSPNTSTSRPVPTYQFGFGSFKEKTELFAAAISIKQTAVSAFHGVVGRAQRPEMIQAFAALAGVQGRHLGVLLELSGQNPFVGRELAISASEAADRLAAFGFKREGLV